MNKKCRQAYSIGNCVLNHGIRIKKHDLMHEYPGYMDTEVIQIDNSGLFDPSKKKVVNRFMASDEKSAKACIRVIHKRKREFAFTPLGKVFCWFGAHTPSLFHFLITRFGTPGAETLDAA